MLNINCGVGAGGWAAERSTSVVLVFFVDPMCVHRYTKLKCHTSIQSYNVIKLYNNTNA